MRWMQVAYKGAANGRWKTSAEVALEQHAAWRLSQTCIFPETPSHVWAKRVARLRFALVWVKAHTSPKRQRGTFVRPEVAGRAATRVAR